MCYYERECSNTKGSVIVSEGEYLFQKEYENTWEIVLHLRMCAYTREMCVYLRVCFFSYVYVYGYVLVSKGLCLQVRDIFFLSLCANSWGGLCFISERVCLYPGERVDVWRWVLVSRGSVLIISERVCSCLRKCAMPEGVCLCLSECDCTWVSVFWPERMGRDVFVHEVVLQSNILDF